MRRNPLRSLAKKRDFDLVFKNGLSVSAEHLVLYARPNELTGSRLGLSVSKKIGTAVVRNRVKRLLRESVRKVLEDSEQHYDFVIIAKKKAAEAHLQNFITEMEKFIPKISHAKPADRSH